MCDLPPVQNKGRGKLAKSSSEFVLAQQSLQPNLSRRRHASSVSYALQNNTVTDWLTNLTREPMNCCVLIAFSAAWTLRPLPSDRYPRRLIADVSWLLRTLVFK